MYEGTSQSPDPGVMNFSNDLIVNSFHKVEFFINLEEFKNTIPLKMSTVLLE